MTEKVKPDSKLEEENGPTENRICTDMICCLLFIANCLAFISIFSIGVDRGKPGMIFAVWDSSGRPCGKEWTNNQSISHNLEDYPYIYFPKPFDQKNFLYSTVCVSKCPVNSTDPDWSTDRCNLTGNVNVTTCTKKCSFLDGGFEFCLYSTGPFLSTVCLPNNIDELVKTFPTNNDTIYQFRKYVNTETLSEWFTALSKAWEIILACFFIAFGVAGLYMLIVRYTAGVMVWLAIFIYIVLIFVLASYCYKRGEEYAVAEDTENEQNLKITGYVLYAIGGLTVLAVICFFRKIQLAVAVIKTATVYVRDVPQALIVPPIFSLFVAAFWVLWIVGFVFCYSYYDSVQKSAFSPFSDITHNDTQKGYIWYFIFGGLWINAFIQACCQFVLVTSVCLWYFAQGGGSLHSPVWKGFKWAFTYHLGTLAFGSFILAVVQLIRIVLAYIDAQSKKAGLDKNACFRFILKCLQCYAACFERFIKFLNRNAYIMCVLKSRHFCYSAKEAMRLLWNNAGRASIIQGLGGIFIFFGELCVCMITTFICYFILTNADAYKEMNPFLPCIVVFFISYTVGILFLSVYGMAIDAIFLCFCHDEEIARGKGQQPKYCPNLLREFLVEHDKSKND